MLKLILVRHGETQGNKLKRYIGKRTDEPLCPEAGNMLAQLAYPEVQAVYASPMIRCTQTAGILFPGKKLNIIDELAECDFGEFENKNIRNWTEMNITSPGSILVDYCHFREERAERNLKDAM